MGDGRWEMGDGNKEKPKQKQMPFSLKSKIFVRV
jgi:hypothetical protein